jgi:hypothetical protein
LWGQPASKSRFPENQELCKNRILICSVQAFVHPICQTTSARSLQGLDPAVAREHSPEAQ